MAEFQLIDLSQHNTVTDFLAVKNAGIYGVILRAGYGREISQKDRKFDQFYAAAKGVGLHIGAYWYSYADSVADAAKEANACLACIQGKQFDFPVYYDLEEQSIAALGRDTCTQIAQTFCSSIEQAGYWAGVYANTNWFTNYLNFDSLAAKYTIWLADYREAYNTTLKRDMHQYTSTGSVAGVNGNVDLDRCTPGFPGGDRQPLRRHCRDSGSSPGGKHGPVHRGTREYPCRRSHCRRRSHSSQHWGNPDLAGRRWLGLE